MPHWTGFADLTFAASAQLAFARALELAETDAYQDHPEAWVIDDRHVGFSLTTDGPLSSLDGTKRLLATLTMAAMAGEASIEVTAPYERWVRRAATPSVSKELAVGDEDGRSGETIRTAAS